MNTSEASAKRNAYFLFRKGSNFEDPALGFRTDAVTLKSAARNLGGARLRSEGGRFAPDSSFAAD